MSPELRAGARVCASFVVVSLCLLMAGCGGHQDTPGGGNSGTGSSPPPPAATAPQITAQPTDTTVQFGQTATFTVTATGTATLSYQWSRNGAPIDGATASTYVTAALTTANSGETYSVVVTNTAGSVTSKTATLTVSAVATATLASSVRILTDAEEGQITAANATQITFSGAITLAPGTVVLGTTHAFKVVSSATSGSQTILTVTEPALGELFSSLIIGGSYTADPSMAVPAQSGVSRSSRQQVRPADSGGASDTLSWPYTFSDGGFTLNATLTSTISAFVDYNFQNGVLNQATLDVSADSQLALSENYTANALTSYEKLLGKVTIPINVTVVDATLSAVGIRLVALQVPIYAGATLGSSFQVASSQTLDVTGSVNLSYDPTNGAIADSSFSGTLSVGSLTPSAPSGQPTLATLNEHGSVYLRMAPALAFVETVALMGVDTKLAVDDSNSLQIVANTPPYCLNGAASLDVAANGFFKALGIAPLKTQDYTATLYAGTPTQSGSCQAPVAVNASTTASQPLSYRTLVPITATVTLDTTKTNSAPSGAPTGTITITAQGASCEATVAASTSTSATGSCSLAPLASGPSVPISVSYSGDSQYSPGTGQTTLDISDSQYSLLGSLVTLTEEEPLGNDFTQPVTVRAGPGVSFSSGNLVTLENKTVIGSTLTVGENSIDITYNVVALADTSSFNGPVFSFGPGSPTIVSCSLDSDSTYTTSQVGVGCNASQVFVNGSSIQTTPGSRILVDLELGPPAQ